MKGFLKRDFYLLLPNLRFYVLFLGLLAFVAVAFEGRMLSFFGFYLVLFSASSVLALFSFDEANHWQAYAAAIPDGRKLQVEGRYAVALAVGGVQLLVLGVFFLTGNLVGGDVLVYVGLFLVYADVALPLSYRFGNNARAVLVILIAALGGILGASGAITSIVANGGGGGIVLWWIGAALIALGLIAMPISRRISVGILTKKVL